MIKKIIGFSMIAAFFLVLFAVMACELGFMTSLVIFGVSIFLVAWLLIAVHLTIGR